MTATPRTTYLVPEPGDQVTRGAAALYRVVHVSEHVPAAGPAWRIVQLASERSGRTFRVPLAQLFWPGTPRDTPMPGASPEERRTVWAACRIVPWEVAYPVADQDTTACRSTSCSCDHHAVRMACDRMAAVVLSHARPDNHTDPLALPSYVGLGVAQDGSGARFLHVAADGPRRDAYLDKAAALELLGELAELVGRL